MNLEKHEIRSHCGRYARSAWYGQTARRPKTICLFLDGEFYVNQMDAPEILVTQTRLGKLPPAACLFLSHSDSAARHRDFTCNADYASYLVNDVIPWLRAHGGVSTDGDYLISGVSLSGLQAAFMALRFSEIFRFVLCQSGSFWWNREWLTSYLGELFSPPTGRFWISVGDKETASGIEHAPSGLLQEIDQITAARGFAEALQAKGREARFDIHPGGHNPGPWKGELATALTWLMDTA